VIGRDVASPPPPGANVLQGVALHRGGPATVRLDAAPGPITLVQRGAEAPLDALHVARADRGVTLASADGRIRVDLVEHLFAALGGLGVRAGVRVTIDEDELPLLDGGALRFAEALLALGLAPAPSSSAPAPAALTIARHASLTRGDAVYHFAPGPEVALRVEVEFRAPVGRESAAWRGDADDFLERIAPARTFGWADEHAALLASGRAAAVDLDAVLVFDDRGAIPGCRPAVKDEVARHKLLDLIGDLAIHGGAPRGSITASHPGHAATHAIVTEALALGVLARSAA
jgi:UDP-3-O-[3-hydroxymyristoyl] N-acetylglucosamine deacetylase